ncbi:MAG: hypothetical protein OZ948_18060 [Deltaproteobacteria bacterium]|nr:hypothetical protein [Deltaproteobacteria bacterium]
MRNVFILLLMVVAIWTAVEVMNHGMGGAFDGLFVELGMADPGAGPEDTPMGRAEAGVERAYERAERRVDEAVQ